MTRSFKAALVIAGFTTAGAMNTTLAHHAFVAEFDREKPVQLTGRVTEMKWSNPHSWIYIDVEDEDGGVVNWALETRAANSLIRLGWRPEDLPVGTVLEVNGWQARNNSSTASIESAELTDGRRIFTGSPDSSARQE